MQQRLIYTIALETAHWNWPVITNPQTYKGIRGNLADFAVACSYKLGYQMGYQNRIGLHALTRALGFDRKLRLGLLDCGLDPEEPDKFVYCETLARL